MRQVFLALVAVSLALAIPAQAAGPRLITQVDEDFVFAAFGHTEGCIFTQVFVSLSDLTRHTAPGAPLRSTPSTVQVFQVDNCLNVNPINAFGEVELEPDEFELRPELDSARLQASFELLDSVSGEPVQATADLTWNAAGPVSREKSHFTSPQPDHGVTNLDISTRPALATGSVTIGTTNYTPTASELATMMVTKALSNDPNSE